MNDFERLKNEISECRICQDFLPAGPNPVVQINPMAKILVAGQAPGIKVHQSNIPFNDASGDRLRTWMDIGPEVFYDDSKIAILPMGFCYPGKGKSGDLPPRKECAIHWRSKVLEQLRNIELTLVIGQYAAKWHFPELNHLNLTDTVKQVCATQSDKLVLPHPSPRNFAWFKRNPWFEEEVVPNIQRKVKMILKHN